jgi:hypothetical protein
VTTSAAAESHAAPADAVLSILKSHEFRQAYHDAIDRSDVSPAVQENTARKIIEAYFSLEPIDAAAPLRCDAVYFTTHGVDVHGHAKFLVPGAVDRHLVHGPLFRLTPRARTLEPLVEPKEFGRAVSAVEAVRLTLVPERVNGIISFIADAKQYYAAEDIGGAERAIATAMDHFNRAASDGLRKIGSDGERGKRGNEVAGTRRKLADLRHKLQLECDRAKGQAECEKRGDQAEVVGR